MDLYWLAFDIKNSGSGARYDTLATRIVGERDDWLYEVEGGVQLGEPRPLRPYCRFRYLRSRTNIVIA